MKSTAQTKRHGFVKVAAAVPAVRVADTEFNATQIIKAIKDAARCGVDIITFPELCITGYSCQDLFRSSLLLDSAEKALDRIMNETKDLHIVSIVGMPVRVGCILVNAAVVISEGDRKSVV